MTVLDTPSTGSGFNLRLRVRFFQTVVIVDMPELEP